MGYGWLFDFSTKTRINEKLSKLIYFGFISSNIGKYDEENLVKAAIAYFKDWSGQEIEILILKTK